MHGPLPPNRGVDRPRPVGVREMTSLLIHRTLVVLDEYMARRQLFEADNLLRSAMTRTQWLRLRKSGSETMVLVLEEVVVAEVDVEAVA
jgi:hypothetical protein